MQKWEYQVVFRERDIDSFEKGLVIGFTTSRWRTRIDGEWVELESLTDFLDTQGSKGWELVSCITGSDNTNIESCAGVTTYEKYFFKRPLELPHPPSLVENK